jgi:molybdenum cofactor cytidylyltransferase
MGAHKLLLQLDGESLIRRTVRAVLEAPLADVVVVTGFNHAAVEAELADLPVRFALNENFARGMGSSFAAGVRALDARTDAALFALADRPFVTAALYATLIAEYHRGDNLLVAGRYDGIIAPPHVVARALFERVGNDGIGIRPLLEELGSAATILDFPASALLDIDEPADLERARSMRLEAPSAFTIAPKAHAT